MSRDGALKFLFGFVAVRLFFAHLVLVATLLGSGASRASAFELTFSINDQEGLFGVGELEILDTAIARTKRMWETVITGYAPDVNDAPIGIAIRPTVTGLASASYTGKKNEGGFWLPTGGFVDINVLEIANFANWQGPGGNGRNYIDELLAHEVGHVLGIGTLWDDNQIYVNNTFQYMGVHGLAAYQEEFDEAAAFVPVENAGNPGTPNSHWDQLLRSSFQEGNPLDPFSLSPLVGVTDKYGRDRGLELMTGAIDPDYGEPFISRFTVQSMRDMGYTVAEFEDFNGDGMVDAAELDIFNANYGATGLEIDSMAFGDASRDRVVDGADVLLWQRAFVPGGGELSVPEPGAASLWALAIFGSLLIRRSGH